MIFYDFELCVENNDRMFEKSNILFDGLNAICYSIDRAICRIVRREKDMVSYSRLWHLLLDKKLKRTQLCEKAGISSSTLAKLGKNEVVSIEVLERICDSLGCDIGDIMSFREGDLKKGE